MNRVWIVKGHYDYEGFTILAVAPTEESAEEFAAPYKKAAQTRSRDLGVDRYDDVTVDEYELIPDCTASCI